MSRYRVLYGSGPHVGTGVMEDTEGEAATYAALRAWAAWQPPQQRETSLMVFEYGVTGWELSEKLIMKDLLP